MFRLFLLSLAQVMASYNTSNMIKCDGVIFHGVYYDKEVLFQNLGRPYNLFMHKFSGVLFFSHTIRSGTQVDFGIIACNINKRSCRNINGVSGGYAIGYDVGNDDIYFGGHDGIYKYNFLTKRAEFFAEEGKSIWSMFVRKNFYYIEYPTQKLFVYQDDRFVKVAEAYYIEIDHFFISKHLDVYFSNKTALYKTERVSRQTIVLSDELQIRQIAEDNYGDVYFCASNGIFLEDKPLHKVKNIANVEPTYGLTFDEKDHPIYSDSDTIYRLNPSKYGGLCLDAILAAS